MYKPSTRKRKKQKELRRGKLMFISSLFILVCATLYIISVSPVAHIRDYTTQGTVLVTEERLTNAIRASVVGKGSIFAPQESLVFVNGDRIEQRMIEIFPEIESVDISRTIRGGLHAVVIERENVYVYCSEICYSVDETGFIYRANDLIENEIELLVFKNRDEKSVGDTIFSEQELAELSLLVDNLRQENLVIKSIYEYSPQTRVMMTPSETKILIPKSEQYDEVFTLLKKMLTTSPFRVLQETQDFVEQYEYINTQFGKKIFSCSIGEICANNYPL